MNGSPPDGAAPAAAGAAPSGRARPWTGWCTRAVARVSGGGGIGSHERQSAGWRRSGRRRRGAQGLRKALDGLLHIGGCNSILLQLPLAPLLLFQLVARLLEDRKS